MGEYVDFEEVDDKNLKMKIMKKYIPHLIAVMIFL